MAMYTSTYQFQGVQGPTDPMLTSNAVEGYQPVSRIGEVVINAFVDAYEFQQLPASLAVGELKGTALYDAQGKAISVPANAAYGNLNGADATAEHKPHFHEWATATPGMICVARRARNASFRNYVAAETASPVIVCAACQPKIMEDQFFFAGVCRSKSVRPIDDGVGPSTDEYFTMAIGGMVTLLNNSSEAVWAGDWIAWTFFSEDGMQPDKGVKRMKKGNPRRIGIELADPLSDRTIGRCLTFAKPGETFDLLLRQA